MEHHSTQTPPTDITISHTHWSSQHFDTVPLNAWHSKDLKQLIDFSDGTSILKKAALEDKLQQQKNKTKNTMVPAFSTSTSVYHSRSVLYLAPIINSSQISP